MEISQGQKDVTSKLPEYFKQWQALLDRFNLKSQLVILFPGNKVPLLGKFALWIISRLKGRIDTQFSLKT